MRQDNSQLKEGKSQPGCDNKNSSLKKKEIAAFTRTQPPCPLFRKEQVLFAAYLAWLLQEEATLAPASEDKHGGLLIKGLRLRKSRVFSPSLS